MAIIEKHPYPIRNNKRMEILSLPELNISHTGRMGFKQLLIKIAQKLGLEPPRQQMN